jgi:hypothetical protein
MQVQPILTFRGVRASAGLTTDIERRVAALERYHRPITSCRVLIELANRHREAGNHYHVRIDLTLPGAEIVVREQPSLRSAVRATGVAKVTKKDDVRGDQKYLRTTLTKAFAVARRRLKDFATKQRGE